MYSTIFWISCFSMISLYLLQFIWERAGERNTLVHCLNESHNPRLSLQINMGLGNSDGIFPMSGRIQLLEPSLYPILMSTSAERCSQEAALSTQHRHFYVWHWGSHGEFQGGQQEPSSSSYYWGLLGSTLEGGVEHRHSDMTHNVLQH